MQSGYVVLPINQLSRPIPDCYHLSETRLDERNRKCNRFHFGVDSSGIGTAWKHLRLTVLSCIRNAAIANVAGNMSRRGYSKRGKS